MPNVESLASICGDLRWRNTMFFLVPLTAMLLADIRSEVDEGPRAAIELYFQAHALGNGDYIRQAFTPEATISFVDGDTLKRWTRDEFAKRFDGPASDEYRRFRRVESLDGNGTPARAVATLAYPKMPFPDASVPL